MANIRQMTRSVSLTITVDGDELKAVQEDMDLWDERDKYLRSLSIEYLPSKAVTVRRILRHHLARRKRRI